MRAIPVLSLVMCLTSALPRTWQAPSFDVAEATVDDIRSALAARRVTCRAVVDAYLQRIEVYDKVALEEAQPLAPVPLARLADGGAGDVDVHAVRRPQGRQQVARAAAEVDDALALRDPHPEDAGQGVVVVAVPPRGPLDPLVVVS